MMHSSNKTKDNRVSQEQVAEIIEAILSGKYSWACVLMLTYLGYEPMHYMPDRTLSRLTKENGFPKQPSNDKVAVLPKKNEKSNSIEFKPAKKCRNIRDLSHLEPVGGGASFLRGGQNANLQDSQSAFWHTFDIS